MVFQYTGSYEVAIHRHVCAAFDNVADVYVGFLVYGSIWLPYGPRPDDNGDFYIYSSVILPSLLEYECLGSLWLHIRAKMGLDEVFSECGRFWPSL